MNALKILSVVVGLLSVFVQAVSGQASSEKELAERWLLSATEQGCLAPIDLIYKECWDHLPEAQREFLSSKPGISVFQRDDFVYEVIEIQWEDRPGVEFCVRPTHEMVVTNRVWNRDTPAMRVELLANDCGWFIVVPRLGEDLFRELIASFDGVIAEYDRAMESISDSDALRWKEMLDRGRKEAVIDEVMARCEIGLDAALILLSYVSAHF